MPSFESAPTEHFTEEERAKIEHMTMEVTNEAREVTHREPLERFSDNLAYIARLHSRDMEEEGYYAHEDQGPEIQYGETHGERLNYFGYNVEDFTSAENLIGLSIDINADPYDVAKETVSSFMTSPPHRETMLDEAYDTMGVGCHLTTKYKFDQEQQPYIHVLLTELFTGPVGPDRNNPKWRS
jgi:uncharacterized protein YkwD